MSPDKKRTNTRKKIITAAAAVFSKKGFHQAKMDEIALEAQVAKGTLYYNFSSKSLLFSATVTGGMETIIEQVRKELVSDRPFQEHFRLLLETMVLLYSRHNDLARIIFNEISSGIDDSVQSEIQQVRTRFTDFIFELLTVGRQKGYIKDIDVRLAAVGIAGIIDSVCSHLIQNPKKTSRKNAVDVLYKILSSGLIKDKARDQT